MIAGSPQSWDSDVLKANVVRSSAHSGCQEMGKACQFVGFETELIMLSLLLWV